ncbi:hypothetical protein PsorP6_011816 [Peronosclerospora sorghi]|uniref:Uncharacterized protein n=1 Tax=Peronosclerospora sorghi TaxID=230839 RepID=A0ACC0WK58_9STRA|nr:hypothetical protein PsorP6_011816 [Peronosclerospora sorghi]
MIQSEFEQVATENMRRMTELELEVETGRIEKERLETRIQDLMKENWTSAEAKRVEDAEQASVHARLETTTIAAQLQQVADALNSSQAENDNQEQHIESLQAMQGTDTANGCPVAIQPHQCFLQEYGDIEAMQRVVLWLIEESREARHLEKIRRERAYLKAPKRRWRYVGGSDQDEESEDALIHWCLLEYGEKMATIAVEEDHDVSVSVMPNEQKNNVDLMAEIAMQAAALAVCGVSKTRKENRKGLRRTKRTKQYAIEFERQYQEVKKQAQEAQHVVANERRTHEAKWLQQVVVLPEEEQSSMKRRVESTDSHVLSLKEKVKKHEQLVQELIKEKKRLGHEKEGKPCTSKSWSIVAASLKDTRRELHQVLEHKLQALKHMAQKSLQSLQTESGKLVEAEKHVENLEDERDKIRTVLHEKETGNEALRMQREELLQHVATLMTQVEYRKDKMSKDARAAEAKIDRLTRAEAALT